MTPIASSSARLLSVAVLAMAVPTVSAQAQGVTGYYRFPAVHGNTIVFTAEGDLWRVHADGGIAQRLTTHASEETRATISPDGRTIAFSASYEGPQEVYTMPLEGGLPVRRTWDGTSARAIGWTPDARLLYATSKYSTLPAVQLHALDLATGAHTRIPLAQASDGSMAADGTLYFTRFDFQGSHTKRYRGGTAQGIWRFAPSDSEAVHLSSGFVGTAKTPLVYRDRIYFASDRTTTDISHGDTEARSTKLGVMNLWSSDLSGGSLRQHSFHTDYDIQAPSLNDGRIVYQQGADIWLLDVRGENAETRAVPRRVDIRLASDLEQLREKWITAPAQYLTSVHISPTGDRVVLVSRGNVYVAPVGAGRLVNATPQNRERWVRFREARFLDSGSLLTLSDESGEVELWKVPANGIGERKQLTKGASILRWDGVPSPDGKYIAHYDKDQKLYLYDVAAGRDRQIAENRYMSSWISSAPGYDDMTWSPDGRWLAFNDVAANMFGRIALYDTQSGRTVHVTSDRYDSYSPAFTPDGAWLYFLSDRTLQSTVGSPWGMRSPDPNFENQTKLYAVQLKKGVRWPFTAKTELDDTAAISAATRAATFDVDGASVRLFELPGVTNGSYSSLTTDGTRLYWMTLASRTPFRRNLMSLELKTEAKPETFAEDVQGYELSADRKKILLSKGSGTPELYVVNAGAKAPPQLAESRVDLAGWTFAVDPRAEYRQMFADAWRLERDYFHDPKMNGVDWAAMRTKYEPLVARVTDRGEFSDLLAQMVGELSTLHIFVNGGDFRRGSDAVLPASLGAVLSRVADGWRVDHIYRSDPDIPEEVGPLARPGVGVSVGDVILSVNGASVADGVHPSELLRNQAGRQVLLSVRSSGASAGSAAPGGRPGAIRQVVVTPIPQSREADLRYDEWEYTRRLMVDSLSGGKVGYVHIRNMSTAGMTEFAREYYPQFNRSGLIIDVRNNTGGNIDTWLLSRLLRQAWFDWKPRVGETYHNMPYAFRGKIVVLVNERTASDGEAFAEGFRRLGLGRVIGTRTWGGEVWLSSSNFLLDRGIATAAEQGVYDFEGNMLIEGWGVEPDFVVDNLPRGVFGGRDLQLEAGVREVTK